MLDLIKNLARNGIDFVSGHKKANKDYEKRYMEFEEKIRELEKGRKEGRIPYYNVHIIAKEIYNVNPARPFLSLYDYIKEKSQ
jgi:hypothetical protein